MLGARSYVVNPVQCVDWFNLLFCGIMFGMLPSLYNIRSFIVTYIESSDTDVDASHLMLNTRVCSELL